ncbi:DUF488 family protein [Virgibacillus sp. YIM 98842]|jgi:uncharacterized protein YeaO (DUF488 family)|uniref:DUF488 domain-containing protein n=1 Tax=Virgibacillus sp. YIM 98842 TaxID=2663533 RepID=UPI0013DC2908|nr:DUF488 family protein [Virgibacillus sp. YIM 98842]
MPVQIKRIYEEKNKDDGIRILVDRVWPRGVSKQDAALDEWVKEAGPSNELRKWFGHDPEKFPVFKEKYKKELESGEQKKALDKLKTLTKKHDKEVTLLFAAKEEKYNQATVLKEILDRQ